MHKGAASAFQYALNTQKGRGVFQKVTDHLSWLPELETTGNDTLSLRWAKINIKFSSGSTKITDCILQYLFSLVWGNTVQGSTMLPSDQKISSTIQNSHMTTVGLGVRGWYLLSTSICRTQLSISVGTLFFWVAYLQSSYCKYMMDTSRFLLMFQIAISKWNKTTNFLEVSFIDIMWAYMDLDKTVRNT